MKSTAKALWVLGLFLAAGCASEPPPPLEVLKPSELNARWKDFDRKPVMVHGWVRQTGRTACIYDDEDAARSNELSDRDRRLAVINIPPDDASRLAGKMDTIKGLFRWDIQSHSPDFDVCHYSGIEFGGAP